MKELFLSQLNELARGELFLPPALMGKTPAEDQPARAVSSETLTSKAFTGLAALADAQSSQVSFFTNAAYEKDLKATQAGIVLVARAREDVGVPQWVVDDPYLAYARVGQYFAPEFTYEAGRAEGAMVAKGADVDPSAHIATGAVIESGASVGPGAVIHSGVIVRSGAKVGPRTELRARVVVEHGVQIGADVLIHAGSVLGGDGFGFAASGSGASQFREKIPQLGTVVIEDRVEIGANATVDRATLGETRIGAGTKMDSSVHIGHNVIIGRDCVICGLVGVAGSARLGDRVILAGQVAVNNHIEVASDVIVGAKGGVTKDLSKPGVYMGFPAVPAQEWRKKIASEKRLADMQRRLRALEALVAKMGAAQSDSLD